MPNQRTVIRELLLKQRERHNKKPRQAASAFRPPQRSIPPCITPIFIGALGEFYFVRYDRRNSGASRGIRTLDTWFRRPVLYPLSYRRLTSVIIAYGEKIRKGKRCLAFARQDDTNQIPLSSSTGSFKTIFLQILSGCASGRT